VKTELTPRKCDASKAKAVYCCSLTWVKDTVSLILYCVFIIIMVNSCHVNVSSLIGHAVMLSGCWHFGFLISKLQVVILFYRESVIFHISKIKTIKPRHFNVRDGFNNI